jgi:hypothetical protein
LFYANVLPKATHPHQILTRLNLEAIQTATMPPKPRCNSQNLVEQEARLQLAVSPFENGQVSSICRAATFDVLCVDLPFVADLTDANIESKYALRKYYIGIDAI